MIGIKFNNHGNGEKSSVAGIIQTIKQSRSEGIEGFFAVQIMK
jgi:hypothetical protein